MIEAYTLESLLKKYGIDINKVLNKNDTILEFGEYQDIDRTLNYLINELKISPRNIEKCPSILYYGVDNIRENHNFLIKTNISIRSIETTLHILSTDSKALKETYNYVLDNYGIEYINKTTSILKIPVSRIKEVEKLLSDKSMIISASYANISIDEIRRIIEVCRNNDIPITGSVFRKTAKEIEDIIIVCRNNGIPITGSVFHKTADEIERIIKLCRNNGISIIGRIFLKTADELEKSINYVKDTYGTAYLNPLIVNKNVNHLKKVLPYLESLNVLPIVINSAPILNLTLEEIIERKEYIESNNDVLVLSNGRFNSIFGLSRPNYKKLVSRKRSI